MRNLHGYARRLEMRDTRKEGINNLSKASGGYELLSLGRYICWGDPHGCEYALGIAAGCGPTTGFPTFSGCAPEKMLEP